MIRVLIAAESEILRRGLAASVPEDAAIEIVESFDPSSGQLAEKIEELQPDAIIFERRGVEDEIFSLLAGREDALVPGIVLLADSPTGILCARRLRMAFGRFCRAMLLRLRFSRRPRLRRRVWWRWIRRRLMRRFRFGLMGGVVLMESRCRRLARVRLKFCG